MAAHSVSCSDDWYPQSARDEWVADTTVHIFGLFFALIGCIALFVLAAGDADFGMYVALSVYALGLIAMLTCSSLYNVNTNPDRQMLLGRIDTSAIFLMIAGTYTPFALLKIGGGVGYGLLAVVWTVAIAGMSCRMFTPWGSPKLFIAIYIVQGWLILVALHPLLAAVSAAGLALLVAGGLLYCIGVVFHVWTGLRFNSAVWHCFVVAAAACHFFAIMREIILVA